MRTVVKFINREDTNCRPPISGTVRIPLMTKTMGKIGLIDDRWVAPGGMVIPAHDEFWYVDIVRETRVGQNSGCFILHPVGIVLINSIQRLVPGFYTEESPNAVTLVVTPRHHLQLPWILPLKLKHELTTQMGISAIVVNLGGNSWYYQPGSKVELGGNKNKGT